MIHVGVDLHQRFCYITAMEAREKILRAGTVTNEKLALRRYFRQFRGKEVQVAVEACGFGPAFREVVEPEVKRLVLVHPQRVKAIASAKLKTYLMCLEARIEACPHRRKKYLWNRYACFHRRMTGH